MRAYLHCVEHRGVNKKRLLRWMREHHLLVPPHLQRKAKRTPLGSNPRPTTPNGAWGIAMTKVLGPGGVGL
jgi:putative transposase